MFRKRREFLSLAAAGLGAQFLPLSKGLAQTGKPPLRLVTIVDAYGMEVGKRGRTWVGSESGDYELSEADLGTVLQPLSGYIGNMLIPTGIDLKSLRDAGGATSHDGCAYHCLSGSMVSGGTGNKARPGPAAVQAHPSIDVRIGDYLNNEYGLPGQRIFPHLYLSDYSDSEHTTFCFDLEGRQIRSRAGAEAIANTLFGDVEEASPLQQISTQARMQVLDLVGTRLQGLRGELVNANASTVLDAYRSSVEELAGEIEIRAGASCAAPTMSPPDGKDGRSNEFIFDAIYHALACDMVSSLTYVIGGEVSNTQRYGFLQSETNNNNVSSYLGGSLHAPSHKPGDAAADTTQEIVRIWQSQLLANLLDRLSATPDVDGQSTIMDNTVIFFPTAMSFNQHKIDNFPYLIIAGNNTRLKGGMHYDCGSFSNNQLLATLAQGLTLPDTEFGGFKGNGDRVGGLVDGGPIEKMLRSA